MNAFQGYSLIELLIVLGVIIIVGLMSEIWLTAQLPKIRLNGATRQIISDFMAARMQAVTRGNKHRISFLDTHRYSILEDKNNNNKPDLGEPLDTKDIQVDYPGVSLQSTNNPIFHPRGTASSLATVTLSNRAGSKRITVSITGRVRIKPS